MHHTSHHTSHHPESDSGPAAESRIADPAASLTTESDHGWTLIEILLVVLILGILAAGAVLAVGGLRAEAADSGCSVDDRSLAIAAGAYFAQTDRSSIPATGTDHDRYERTLVSGGFLRNVSTYHDLDATGAATPEGNTSC